MSGGRWFVPLSRRPGRLRLYCLPYAGGSAASYLGWAEALPDVEVVGVQLPGRGSRVAETPIRHMEPLIDALAPAVAAESREPFALFGHSLGALVAYELARRLRALDRPGPVRLLASGMIAPHLPRRARDVHDLPREQFFEELRAYNGTPEEVLGRDELLDLVEPALRADFEVVETYRHRQQPPLSVPLSVFGGDSDPDVFRDELQAWRIHSTGAFKISTLPGDHFFVNSARHELLRLVARELTATPAEPARD